MRQLACPLHLAFKPSDCLFVCPVHIQKLDLGRPMKPVMVAAHQGIAFGILVTAQIG